MPSRDQILSFEETPRPPGKSPWVVPPTPSAIEVVEYDPEWPTIAERVVRGLRAALGLRALRIEHVGSTAVPGLAAKPVIDLDLTVADPGDERGWLPPLQEAGYVLTVREPWWHEHRLLQRRSGEHPAVNLHVFGPDSPESVKHAVFREWLRADPADRELYAEAKRSAAAGPDQRVMDYNARKQAAIRDIYQRAFTAAGFLP
ncbi:GrpB family protein [Rathayibacter sp. VKM Ac-2801]|uniref:GrpB family protein n=1 Tax=Rathayibacter sp. VKM Ac-2801 TaxID=2609255 RepID=UPI00131F8F21|nr:GrpB family protein [Rathayibacter sp. VKM Ac-2801]QHC69215.1 GrpB family protein [Rathayibacter sp. VKM Ac-2801]